MNVKTISFSLLPMLLTGIGTIAAVRHHALQRVTAYYQLPGQPVTSTVTTACPEGPYPCRIVVNGQLVPIFKDPGLRVSFTCHSDRCFHQ